MAEPTAAPEAVSHSRDQLQLVRDKVTALGARARTLPRPRPPAWLLITIGIGILTWGINPLPPGAGGYDISWITAMHVAAHSGLHWGSQFNYTYGPLAYLTIANMFFDRTGIPAAFVTGALYLGMLAVVARPLCRAFGLVVGGLLLFALARIAASGLDPVELLTPLLVVLGILVVRRPSAHGDLRVVIGIAALAAFSTLDKLSAVPVGIAVVGLLAIVAAANRDLTRRERIRAGGIWIGAFASALIVLWLLAGQSLFDLPAYFRNGLDTVNGYGDAQSQTAPGLNWLYGWALVSTVVVFLFVFLRDRGLPAISRIVIALLWLLFVWVTFRHAFTRLSAAGHTALFFSPLALVAAAVLVGPDRWRVALIAALIPVGVVWHVGAWNVPALFTASTATFVQHVNLLFGPNYRHTSQAAAAHGMQQQYAFPAQLVRTLTGQTVHFDPWEAAIAYAYSQFKWDPPPVFQTYNAYTSHLDDLNADFLAGPRAPRYILRQNAALDDRQPRFDSPRYMLEMICRYRQVMVIPGWTLLERGADRCGAATPISSHRVSFGQRTGVPAATRNSIVVARFTDFSQPLSDTLAKLLFKRHTMWIALDQAVFRFIPGHASNPHVMSFPSCVGWGPQALDPTLWQRIGIGRYQTLTKPGATESDSSYKVSFERISFNCAG